MGIVAGMIDERSRCMLRRTQAPVVRLTNIP
jgi:hypothetical protein